MARLFSRKQDWLSAQNQSKSSYYRQTRAKDSRLENVEDDENRRAGARFREGAGCGINRYLSRYAAKRVAIM